jgi:two-component system sensor histidine kinase RstB
MSRLVLRFFIGILLVLGATFLITSWGARHAFHHHFQDEVPDLLGEFEAGRLRLDAAADEARMQAELRALRASVVHPLQLLETSSERVPGQVRARMAAGNLFAVVVDHGRVVFYGAVRGGERVLAMGPLKKMKREHTFPLAPVLAAIIGVIVLTSLLFALPLVRRLRTLERATERISAGDLQARAELASKDAIGRLARRFNAMADRVQGLLESQQELLQAVSHELRTPAARIRFGLEMLAGARDEAERRSRITAIDEDLEELDELVEELLLYIRSGDSARRLERRPLVVVEQLEELAGRLAELRPEVGVEVAPDGARALEADADEKLFRRAMQNLLTNAIRHARGRVTVTVEGDDGMARVAVCDDGPGVPPEHRERIFEPFTRVDDSRSREQGGSGLGLAIVKRILERHGGAITLADAEQGGACFVASWPLAGPR